MNATLQRLLTHCTEEERKEEMWIYVFAQDCAPETEVIDFDLSDVVFDVNTGKIQNCKINGAEAPENIEALNTLITENMISWFICNGHISIDIEIFCPSAEYLKDLYFFEKYGEEF